MLAMFGYAFAFTACENKICLMYSHCALICGQDKNKKQTKILHDARAARFISLRAMSPPQCPPIYLNQMRAK